MNNPYLSVFLFLIVLDLLVRVGENMGTLFLNNVSSSIDSSYTHTDGEGVLVDGND